jgi:phospholipid-translocating ATPase|tara:strand:- start:632 stop:844 length:213 start_codon:yes stop_codon:yes gene_type:complete
MNFLGVTGLEETIQENCKETIQALKTADIKIWMFTGDRVENGTSVAQSAGLMNKSHQMFFICNDLNKSNI